MNYYNIALPLNLPQLFTYRYPQLIEKGCRVLVSFHNKSKTGIVWEKLNQIPEKKIEYKRILEIVDEKPILNNDLLVLAKWISEYYFCSLGSALFSMLPSAINIQLQQKVIKINEGFLKESNGISEQILKEMSSIVYQDISLIKDKLKIPKFHYWLERLEEENIIRIQRTFDEKIKKKVANFVIKNDTENVPELTEKQKKLFAEISGFDREFPLSKIAEDYSYALVKALKNKGLIRIEAKEIDTKNDIYPGKTINRNITLTDEQNNVAGKINEALDENIFKCFLLFGITGSGKTEVYLKIIRHCLKKGKNALMLVPEISLTPQMVEKLFSEFGKEIAILHSHLNDRQRWEQWKKIKHRESRIVVGARSAIFAPLQNIGAIIVDEEHETSYKQDKTPQYNGRDLALVRAKELQAVVVLGSATPSLESWVNVKTDKYQLLQLTKRPENIKLPEVKIIDMRSEKTQTDIFSRTLLDAIQKRLKKREQVILFQNRRGHSSFVQCISCGDLFTCPNCEISLKYHSSSNELICHYCGNKQILPRKCPSCGNYLFSFGAPGTQQVEKQLKIIFPNARILRMDSDTTRKKESYNSMFDRMRAGNIDILLGTQMIAKGLDFPNVTLVGVISADIGLNFPDFRAAERTFQLLTQVAGRSGRGKKTGEVIIQTYNPKHYSIKYAMEQDFPAFSEKELELRQLLKYPPYFRIARILYSAEKQKYLHNQITNNIPQIKKLHNSVKKGSLQILGPTPTPLIKLKNRYRYHIIIKSKNYSTIYKAVNFVINNTKFGNDVRQIVDIDPYSLL